MFFCAISGEPPQDPVISSKSGHVYERRLIEKYITENGTDPVTGEKLEEGDLISVKASTSWALGPHLAILDNLFSRRPQCGSSPATHTLVHSCTPDGFAERVGRPCT